MKNKELMLRLRNMLVEKTEGLKYILSDYQTQEVTEYEIERCIRTIDGLEENARYLDVAQKIDAASIMLPSNLPLYSLVIFVLIPALLSENVYVRPNSILQERNIISRIVDELGIDKLFPQVHVINADHAGFESYIKGSSLVVFTGKPSNADKFLAIMKQNSVFVINGAGHNPLVVTESADIDKAVAGALLVKGFNGGQDCAGPDAILVHERVANQFIDKFKAQFSQLKTGLFKDQDTVIGPIHRYDELQRLAGIIHSNSKDILTGGSINFRTGIVEPTVVVRGIERHPNYQEVYGPIAFIHPYKNDAELRHYFQDPDGRYSANRMYVTVYGNSQYIMSRNDGTRPGLPGNIGIVIPEQTIHDVEIGYKAYGGYSMGASGVIKKTSTGVVRVAMPILLPEIIAEYLIKKNDPQQVGKNVTALEKPRGSSIKKGNEIQPIIEEFQKIAADVFQQNLLFGFVFGSAAKDKLKVKGDDKDDLDTFVCLNDEDPKALDEYNRRIAILHHRYGLKVDETFPSEVMTLAKLKLAIDCASKLNVSLDKPIQGEDYDHLFWVHAISDKKVGFIGDGKVLSQLIKLASQNIYRWKDQILSQLKDKTTLPRYLSEKFAGLNKEEVLAKLSGYSPHLIVHLGLDYVNENTQMAQVVPAPKLERAQYQNVGTNINSIFAAVKEKLTPATSIKPLSINFINQA